MKTLRDHIISLAKHVAYSEDEILMHLVTKTIIVMDEDSLLGYWFFDAPEGKAIFAGWTDGNGQKIDEWVTRIAKENNCVAIYGASRRWRAFCRKYGAKLIKDLGKFGYMFMREVDN